MATILRRATATALAVVVAGGLAACSDQLHRVGIGPSDGGGGTKVPTNQPLTISSDEALKRLAKLLWNTTITRDAALLVPSGGMKTRADVAAVAQQMLKDGRAKNGMGAFYRWWLDLDKVPTITKDPVLFPQWTAELAADAARETEAFAVDTTFDPDGSFETLMTGACSFINERLAAIYGVSGITGTQLQKVNFTTRERAGLLTHASLLAVKSATRTSPTARGHFVRRKLFCTDIQPGPSGFGLATRTDLPFRQQVESAMADSSCQSCHAQMDPLGFAYEGYDSIGRFRTMDNGSPVNLTGKVSDSDGVEVAFNGPLQLAANIIMFDVVQSCMARQWLSHAMGRTLQPSEDAAVDSVRAAFKSSGLNIRALIVAVAQSEVFLAP